ncbi:DUF805 domain-containing protein [Sphingomonas montana]|uniref:DUF805 domain-containing protein n=1 Tax=Sphingomonas montana TaxID=1843236 RepID=UPI0009F9AA14|nr:DUF805 domain-containing protein [Sphingomonas montana]
MSSTPTPMPRNVIEAAILPLRRFARFRGRSSRMEFWSFTAATIAAQIVIAVTFPLVSWPLWLFLILPSQAVLVRRLHDVDRSGWWALPMPLLVFSLVLLLAMTQFTLGNEAGEQILVALGIVTPSLLILGTCLVVWTCRRGVSGPNRFGEALLPHDAVGTSAKPPAEP